MISLTFDHDLSEFLQHVLSACSLRAGSLVWVGYYGQGQQRIENWQIRREEWGKEKWACTRAIDFLIPPLARCQVGISDVSIGAKQNVNKHDSTLHAMWRLSRRMVKLHGWRDELTFNYWLFGEFFFNLRPHTTEFPFLYYNGYIWEMNIESKRNMWKPIWKQQSR